MNILNRLKQMFQYASSESGDLAPTEYSLVVPVVRRDRKSSIQITLETTFDNEVGKFEELSQDDSPMEEYINKYLGGCSVMGRAGSGQVLDKDEWERSLCVENGKYVYHKDLYYSIFKGLDLPVRIMLWETMSQSYQFKEIECRDYQQFTNPSTLSKANLHQIEQDVPRSRSVTTCKEGLRNILVAYCNYSGQDYTQGMNMLAGALLTQMDSDRDGLEEQCVSEEYQERVFWVFVGIILHRGWHAFLDNEFSGLTQALLVLESLIKRHVPQAHAKIVESGWDMSLFAQHYITIMQMNTPVQFAAMVMDLFMLDGQNALHSIIVGMLRLNLAAILLCDETDLIGYLNKGMILDTFNRYKRDQKEATCLEEFVLNYLRPKQEGTPTHDQ